MTDLSTRILLADDHAIVRGGLRLILEREPDLEVVAEAADGVEAVTLALSEDVDLAILDVSMPLITGLQAARRIAAHRPNLKILMLSVHDNEEFFFEALDAGAHGYVLKNAAADDLVAAARAVVRGEPFLYAGVQQRLLRELLERVRAGDEVPQDPLTSREAEIVKLIAEGHTGREIAELLSISENTVERHRQNVFEKLELRNRVALTRYAVRRGLIEP